MQTIKKVLISVKPNISLEFPEDMLLGYNGLSFPLLVELPHAVLIDIEEYGNLWFSKEHCIIVTNTIL